MKTYAVGYDLNSPGKDYAGLIVAIKSFGAWWHYLDSTWIIKTDKSAATIRDTLKPYIDSNDELLVMALTGESAWSGFNPRGSKWLSDNISPT